MFTRKESSLDRDMELQVRTPLTPSPVGALITVVLRMVVGGVGSVE